MQARNCLLGEIVCVWKSILLIDLCRRLNGHSLWTRAQAMETPIWRWHACLTRRHWWQRDKIIFSHKKSWLIDFIANFFFSLLDSRFFLPSLKMTGPGISETSFDKKFLIQSILYRSRQVEPFGLEHCFDATCRYLLHFPLLFWE